MRLMAALGVLALGGALAMLLASGLVACPVAAFGHVACPSCGSTRAMRLLFSGHLLDAFTLQPFATVAGRGRTPDARSARGR